MCRFSNNLQPPAANTGRVGGYEMMANPKPKPYSPPPKQPVKVVDGVKWWRCTKCGGVKPASDFFRWRKASNGLKPACKPCSYRVVKETQDRDNMRRLNAEAGRRYAVKPKTAEARFKQRARSVYQAAIRRGEIARPQSCEECGRPCKPHGHHDDYSKPLDVRWLCTRCHAMVHSRGICNPQNTDPTASEVPNE